MGYSLWWGLALTALVLWFSQWRKRRAAATVAPVEAAGPGQPASAPSVPPQVPPHA